MAKSVKKDDRGVDPTRSKQNPEVPSGKNQVKLVPWNLSLEKPVDIPFFSPSAVPKEPNEPWRSPVLSEASDLLKIQGIPPAHLKTGLLTFDAMLSAYFNNPLGWIIMDEEGIGAGRIAVAVKKLIPDDAYVELHEVTEEILFKERMNLKNKAIVVPGGSKLKKSFALSSVVELQQLSQHTTVRAKYGDIFQPLQVEGPISCVVIVRDPRDSILKNPSFLRIHLSGAESSVPSAPLFDGAAQIELQLRYGRMKKTLERFWGISVETPFEKQFLKSLVDSKVSHPEQKCETFSRMIKIHTLFNNSPCALRIEAYAGQYGLDRKAVVRYLELKGKAFQENKIVATKHDFYDFWVLADGTFYDGDDSVTGRQRRIFEALKRKGMGRISATSVAAMNTDAEKLIVIAKDPSAWLDIEALFEELTKDPGEIISLSTLNRELDQLLKKGIIVRQRPKKKFVYAVATLSIGGPIKLPHPSAIDDPILNKESIQVVNPLTGKIETI